MRESVLLTREFRRQNWRVNVKRNKKFRCSLVSELMSNPAIYDLALAVTIALAFALYQETPPGTWALIRRILGRW